MPIRPCSIIMWMQLSEKLYRRRACKINLAIGIHTGPMLEHESETLFMRCSITSEMLSYFLSQEILYKS